MEKEIRQGFNLGIRRSEKFLNNLFFIEGERLKRIIKNFNTIIKDFHTSGEVQKVLVIKNIYGNVGLLYAHSILWRVINDEYKKAVEDYQADQHSAMNVENLVFLKNMKDQSRIVTEGLPEETKENGLYFYMAILLGRYNRDFILEQKESLLRTHKYKKFEAMQKIMLNLIQESTLNTYTKQKGDTMKTKTDSNSKRKLAVEVSAKRPLASQVDVAKDGFTGHIMCDGNRLRIFCPGMNRNNATAHISDYKTLIIKLNDQIGPTSIPKAYSYDIEKWMGKINLETATLADGILNISFYSKFFSLNL